MSNYGIPYMGSKAKICEKVCALFPKADNFYDLFGGGFSVTHFMLQHRGRDYKQFHFNEIRAGVCDLIKDAIAGKYNYKNYSPPWVSRQDFERLKELDPLIKIIWSFGNNGKGYLFGKDIEQDKKSMHMAVVFNEFDDYAKEVFGMDKFRDGFDVKAKRLFLKNRIRLLGKDRLDLQQLEQLERLEQLQRLQQLEQLERLQQLEQLQRLQRQSLFFFSGSYEKVVIKKNSVVYCDIPYGGTAEYDNSSNEFNRKKFFDWANELGESVFISEYRVEDSRFKCIANFKKRSLISSDNASHLVKTEKVYANKIGYERLMTRNPVRQERENG
jgi:site-specific DNA-adenine methylase